MKTDLLVLMLCSVFVHLALATHRLRYFEELKTPPYDQFNWTQASTQCENISASLITLYDEDDAKFMGHFKGKLKDGEIDDEKLHTILVWLGLSHKSLHGSGGGSVSQCGTAEDPDEQKCVAIHNNLMQCLNCMEQKFFMCNTKKKSTLVNIRKTWCQALQHCRKHYNTNLANSSSTAQIGHDHSFWIGQRYDNWQWHDNGCSPFRKWVNPGRGSPKDPQEEKCTALYHENTPDSLGLYKYLCKSQVETFCSKGTVRIKVINESKTWEDAYDYCKDKHTRLLWIRDKKDQAAVEQWLNYTDTDINNEFWIGLRQSRVFGFWIWSSDTTVGYHSWKYGKVPEQPNSHLCGIIDKNDMKWRDEECNRVLPFLCEEDIVYLD